MVTAPYQNLENYIIPSTSVYFSSSTSYTKLKKAQTAEIEVNTIATSSLTHMQGE